MTLDELIQKLEIYRDEGHDGDTPVRLAVQPNWPLCHTIDDISYREGRLWLAASHGHPWDEGPYAPKNAWGEGDDPIPPEPDALADELRRIVTREMGEGERIILDSFKSLDMIHPAIDAYIQSAWLVLTGEEEIPLYEPYVSVCSSALQIAVDRGFSDGGRRQEEHQEKGTDEISPATT